MVSQSEVKQILIIGGSGFVSGTLARRSVAAGHRVWILTRGQRALPAGVTSLIADRHDTETFEGAVAGAGMEWDLVVDCIGYDPADIEQDVRLFRDRTPHLVFVSTDFVYDPTQRRFPQGENSEHYAVSGYGRNKYLCELALERASAGSMAWTVVRPCHIYGPGSQLGCLPTHGRDPRLIERLRAGESLALVGAGHFLQQPILAADLADTILDMVGNESTHGEIFCAAGPDIIESRTYYQIVADILGVELSVEELPVNEYVAQYPDSAPFLCHRIYDLTRLATAGIAIPSTPIRQGLAEQVESLMTA